MNAIHGIAGKISPHVAGVIFLLAVKSLDGLRDGLGLPADRVLLKQTAADERNKRKKPRTGQYDSTSGVVFKEVQQAGQYQPHRIAYIPLLH
jgi:hypothetical protein